MTYYTVDIGSFNLNLTLNQILHFTWPIHESVMFAGMHLSHKFKLKVT